MKTQLDFRKKVLEQTHLDKSIFFITRHSRQLSIAELSDNLGRLLSSSQTQSCPVGSSVTLNCESLIGKEINHRWKSEGGVERWYRGTVLSFVPGTTDWFNVQYEGEDNAMSLNLLMDIENGDLDIVGSSCMSCVHLYLCLLIMSATVHFWKSENHSVRFFYSNFMKKTLY